MCFWIRADEFFYFLRLCSEADLDGVISVQSALYGRADSVTCTEEKPPNQISNTDCSLAGIDDAVKKRYNTCCCS